MIRSDSSPHRSLEKRAPFPSPPSSPSESRRVTFEPKVVAIAASKEAAEVDFNKRLETLGVVHLDLEKTALTQFQKKCQESVSNLLQQVLETAEMEFEPSALYDEKNKRIHDATSLHHLVMGEAGFNYLACRRNMAAVREDILEQLRVKSLSEPDIKSVLERVLKATKTKMKTLCTALYDAEKNRIAEIFSSKMDELRSTGIS